MVTSSSAELTSSSVAACGVTKLAQAKAEIASITCDLGEIEDRTQRDEQRMFFLLNATSARQDFYEIRSAKDGEVRRLVINDSAEIVFDSEQGGNDQLPEFDEIDDKFSHVIPDDSEGRRYYRKLRGLHYRKRRGLQKRGSESGETTKEEAMEEARQLRHTIVENFRQQDCIERQSEIEEILARKETGEQQHSKLRARQEELHQMLLLLQKEIADEELKREQAREVENAAERKREHDSKRLAWLDRFSQPPQVQPAQMDNNAAKDDDQSIFSEVSTSCDDLDIEINNDQDMPV